MLEEDTDFLVNNSQSLITFGSYMSPDEYLTYFVQQVLKKYRLQYLPGSDEYSAISELILAAEELAKENGMPHNLGAFEESILSLMGKKIFECLWL